MKTIKLGMYVIIILLIILSILSFSNCISTKGGLSESNIYITVSPDTIIVNGDISHITVQLYNKNIQNNISGVNVSFESDNTSIGYILDHRYYNITNENGSTTIDAISNKTLGRFKVTASCEMNGKTISNSTYINVVDWGSISGLVLDKNGNGTGGANVTLWNIKYNESTQGWDNKDILNISWWGSGYSNDNPIHSYYGKYSTIGSFGFTNIPLGTYNLTVEKEGNYNHSIVIVEKGTTTHIITLPDYMFDGNYYNYYIPSYKIPIPTSITKNGVIWGVLNDYHGFPINDANITLYNARFNDITKQWDQVGIVNIKNNPQQSRNFTSSLKGGYQFDNVPSGDYILTAEYEGQNNYAVAHVNNNVSITFISLLRIPPY